MTNFSTAICLVATVCSLAQAADHKFGGARRLNNLTWEVLKLDQQPVRADQTYHFTTPRSRWIYLHVRGTDADNPLRFSLDDEPILELSGGAQETMRFLPAGVHRLGIHPQGSRMIDHLVLRSIPEILLHNFTDRPAGRFKTTHADYLQQQIIPHVNTFVVPRAIVVGEHPYLPMFHKWRNSGRRWLSSYNAHGTPDVGDGNFSVDEAFQFITTRAVVTSPLMDGTLCDEFVGYDDISYANYGKAFRRIKALPAFEDKLFYIYAVTLHSSPHGRALANSIIETGGVLAWERYLATQPTAAAARAYLEEVLLQEARHYRRRCPGSIERMAACFGFYSKPGGHMLNLYPGVNQKVWLDMQFHLAANDPTFRDLYGLMGYHTEYSDEETLRWMCKLFRHYGIEGRTERATSDPYLSPHLDNGDFVEGLSGWTIDPAADESVRAIRKAGLGYLQARDGKPQGDTALRTVRSAARPNRFSQELTNLQPGRWYTFRMMTANLDDLSKQVKPAVRVTIDGVKLAPERSFTQLIHNPTWRKVPPFDGERRKAWHTYHWHLFQAQGKTARLTISDWLESTTAGGPVGQQLAFNYLQVHPYFASP